MVLEYTTTERFTRALDQAVAAGSAAGLRNAEAPNQPGQPAVLAAWVYPRLARRYDPV
jgi:hypothetical protein